MLLKLDNLLVPADLDTLQEALAGARFSDGSDTAGTAARRVKTNQQLAPGSQLAQRLGLHISEGLRRNAVFVSSTLPRRMSPPLFNRYSDGMAYGSHVDNALMWQPEPLRSDVSVTVFLSDPKSYDGGELIIEDSSFGSHKIKLAAGSAFLYPSTTLHRVAPVTRGVRLAAVVWVQSLVANAERRRVLFDLDMSVIGLRKRLPEAPEIVTLGAVYHNLLRQWAQA